MGGGTGTEHLQISKSQPNFLECDFCRAIAFYLMVDLEPDPQGSVPVCVECLTMSDAPNLNYWRENHWRVDNINERLQERLI